MSIYGVEDAQSSEAVCLTLASHLFYSPVRFFDMAPNTKEVALRCSAVVSLKTNQYKGLTTTVAVPRVGG